MILRTMTLAGGLMGAAGLSQFPEFSQQYLQRLAGTVDELHLQVAAFDKTAEKAGLSREAALAQRSGNDFLDMRQSDAAAMIARSDRLSADLAVLREAGPVARLWQAPRLTDGEIARAAMEDFRPALPLTLDGALCAVLGFLGGSAAMGGAAAVARWPFRRKAREAV